MRIRAFSFIWVATIAVLGAVALFPLGEALAGESPGLAYFRQAKINWRQFEGQTLTIGLNKHPYTESLLPQIGEFEALTGIKVEYLILPENSTAPS